jgi:hypothetical protein
VDLGGRWRFVDDAGGAAAPSRRRALRADVILAGVTLKGEDR